MRNLNRRRSRRGPSLRRVYVLAALLAVAGLGSLVRGGRTSEIDTQITLCLQRRKAPWFSRLMHLASWAGFPPQSRTLPLVVPGVVFLLGYRLEALFQLLGWGTSAISGAIKMTMRRPRPNHPEILVSKARIGGTSFPSGHVINYIGVYGFLGFLAHRHLRPIAFKRLVVGAIAGLIALVGPSRIYLGHHWASDVLASYLLGTSYLLFLTSIYRRVRAFLGDR